MKAFFIGVAVLALMWISAVAHEGDLSRNFNETGDAKAWIYKIKR